MSPVPAVPIQGRTMTASLVRGTLVALAAGALLSFTGAFETFHLPFLQRLAYWTPVMLIGALWGFLCSRLVDRYIDSDQRPWLASVVVTLVIAGPLSVAVWAITGVFFRDGGLDLDALPYFLVPVSGITFVISLVNVLIERQPIQTHAAPEGAPVSRFPDRLPKSLRGATIHAVQSEDHYLRIHTDRGSDLILMRLADAVAELEGLEGAQVHRSWWVARDAVVGVTRGDGRATLALKGGVTAPVSRRYAPALRKAGWY